METNITTEPGGGGAGRAGDQISSPVRVHSHTLTSTTDENKLFLTSALLSTGRNVSYRDLKRKERAGGADHLDFYLL